MQEKQSFLHTAVVFAGKSLVCERNAEIEVGWTDRMAREVYDELNHSWHAENQLK